MRFSNAYSIGKNTIAKSSLPIMLIKINVPDIAGRFRNKVQLSDRATALSDVVYDVKF